MQNSTKKLKKSEIQLFNRENILAIFEEKIEIRERCKGVHCVDLGESFPTSIYLQKSASIQPRTSPSKIGGNYSIVFNRVLSRAEGDADEPQRRREAQHVQVRLHRQWEEDDLRWTINMKLNCLGWNEIRDFGGLVHEPSKVYVMNFVGIARNVRFCRRSLFYHAEILKNSLKVIRNSN